MASYFEPEPFWNVSDLGEQNSYEFNINESVLFSKFSQKQMTRFYELEDERFKQLEEEDEVLAWQIYEEEKKKHDFIVGKIPVIEVEDEEPLDLDDEFEDENDKPLEESKYFDANLPPEEPIPALPEESKIPQDIKVSIKPVEK